MIDYLKYTNEYEYRLRSIAESLKTNNVDSDTLIDAAKISIAKNIEYFDEDLSGFSTFVSVCAKSAMIDYLRRFGSTVKNSYKEDMITVSMDNEEFEEGRIINFLSQESVEDKIFKKELETITAEKLRLLYDDYDLYFVITRTFGLNDHTPLTAADITEEMGVSPTTYKKKMQEALSKLKTSKELRDLYEK